MPKYRFVDFDEFTPDDPGWSALGRVVSWDLAGSALILTVQPVQPAAAPAARPGAGVPLRIEFLSPTLFRVRFNPEGDYRADVSYAVVDRAFGPAALRLDTGDPEALSVDTGQIRVRITKDPYGEGTSCSRPCRRRRRRVVGPIPTTAATSSSARSTG